MGLCSGTTLWFIMCLQFGINFGFMKKDLTKKQLALVAEAFSLQDCKFLFADLLKNMGELKSHQTYLKQVHKQPTCLDMITYWNVVAGEKATSRVLADNLARLGKESTAQQLSKSVYEARVKNVAVNFMFEERPPAEIVSILAQEAPRYHRQRVIDESEGTIIGYRPLHALIFSLMALMIFIVTVVTLLVLVPLACPAVKRYMSDHFRVFGFI